jgi:hypothetical protein
MSEGPGGAPPTRTDEPTEGAPPTRADPAPVPDGSATRADGDDTAGPPDLEPFVPDRLPPALAHYRIEEELPGGAQATLYRCSGPQDEQVVVKIYHRVRPGIQDVWARWAAADPRRVVPLVGEPLVVGTRCYEVTPYQQRGSLEQLRERHGGRLPDDLLEAVVRQVADALHHVHTELGAGRLVHRDIKPSNILVADAADLAVRLTDFGISVVQEDTYVVRATESRTVAYAAPEVLTSRVVSTPAQDWWSLGMTIAELGRGLHPFQLRDGRWRSDADIINDVALRPVPVPSDIGPRWLSLVRGLLVRDPEARWGYGDVQAWLTGHPNAIPEDAAPIPDVGAAPFEFPAGEHQHRPADLAAAIADHWPEAVTELVLTDRRWSELRDWAAAVEPGLRAELGRVFTQALSRSEQPDLAATELMVALDRAAPPVFRGRDVHREGLATLAAHAAADGVVAEAAARDVDLLWDTAALEVLAALDRCADLHAVDHRWRQFAAAADVLVARLAEDLPDARLPAPQLLRFVLLAAAATDDGAARLAAGAARVATRRNLRLDWFRRLADRAEGVAAPAAHGVMVLASGLADDARFRNPPGQSDRVRLFLAERVPEQVQRARRGAGRAGRSTLRATPLVVGVLGYLALVAAAGLGVAAATSAVEAALVGGLLLAEGAALFAGVVRPRHRFADALVTGWAGTVVGLPMAAGLGAVVSLVAGPLVGWPVFWGAWVVIVVAGTALGAVR